MDGLGFFSSSETRMTAQCTRAGSLFSVAGGVWVFGNAGNSERENFKKGNGAMQRSGGPRNCSQEIDR